MEILDQVIFETRDPTEKIRQYKMEILEEYDIALLPLVQQVIDIGEGKFLVILNLIKM